MNSITMKMRADKLIRMALQEDITSEDVSTNAVMRSAVKGTVDLIAKEDGIIAGLDVYARVFQILDEKTEISFNFKDGEAVKLGVFLVFVFVVFLRSSWNSNRRYPGASFRRESCPELSPENEWYRYLYKTGFKASGRK